MIDLDEFKKMLAPHVIPIELEALIKFQNMKKEPYSGEFFVSSLENFEVVLSGYSNEIEFHKQFVELATANGSGSIYAFWINKAGNSLSECPIVVFGDEGGVHVVASNFRGLLRLISYDGEPMVSWSSVVYYKNDEDFPSPRHVQYINWLSQFGLTDIEDPKLILERAKTNYQQSLDDLLN